MGILKASGLLKVVGQLYMTVYVQGYTLKASSLLKVRSTIYDYLRPWVYSKQADC